MQNQKLIKKGIKIIIIVFTFFLVFCAQHPDDALEPIFLPIHSDFDNRGDTIPPVIQLDGGTVELNLGETFEDPGYKLEDAPGPRDISEMVKVKRTVKNSDDTIKNIENFYLQEGEYTVYYNAEDCIGNKADEKTRKVIVGPDIEKPELILYGPENVTLLINQPFMDPGVEAFDNVDEDITDKIKKEEEVDVSEPGEYKIKYTVSDKAGNKAERYRTVMIMKNKNPPKAEAGSNKTAGINDPVNLNGLSIDTDGKIVKHEWKFGSSDWVVTSTHDTTIKAPPTAQTYVCSLRVTDNDGLTGVDYVIITVTSSAPTAEAGPDTTVGINDPIYLHGKGVDTAGSIVKIVKYEWKFGGSDWVVTSTGDTTIGAPPTAQTYVCSLRVTDDDGLTGVDGIVITVLLTVTDIDGNVYHTVKIGKQIWTVENLRTTKLNDGTNIIKIISDREWVDRSAGTSAYCYHEKVTSSIRIAKFGALYSWHVVNSGKIAPPGWHVPTDDDWDKLEEFLKSNGHNWDGTTGGNKIGKSMAAKSDWDSSNAKGTPGTDKETNNSSGFSGLPGGYRHFEDGTFKGYGRAARWWSATEKYDKSEASSRTLYRNDARLKSESVEKANGFSIRLVKD